MLDPVLYFSSTIVSLILIWRSQEGSVQCHFQLNDSAQAISSDVGAKARGTYVTLTNLSSCTRTTPLATSAEWDKIGTCILPVELLWESAEQKTHTRHPALALTDIRTDRWNSRVCHAACLRTLSKIEFRITGVVENWDGWLELKLTKALTIQLPAW